jgi:putative transcriptional regulator
MNISYKKLWIQLIERELKRTDLITLAGISGSTLAKLGKNESVKLEILMKICEALELNIGDITDFIPENK